MMARNREESLFYSLKKARHPARIDSQQFWTEKNSSQVGPGIRTQIAMTERRWSTPCACGTTRPYSSTRFTLMSSEEDLNRFKNNLEEGFFRTGSKLVDRQLKKTEPAPPLSKMSNYNSKKRRSDITFYFCWGIFLLLFLPQADLIKSHWDVS